MPSKKPFGTVSESLIQELRAAAKNLRVGPIVAKLGVSYHWLYQRLRGVTFTRENEYQAIKQAIEEVRLGI